MTLLTSPQEAAMLIALAGGDTSFGRLLGIDQLPKFQQRVNNWKRRGMPAEIVLEHYGTLQKLLASANA